MVVAMVVEDVIIIIMVAVIGMATMMIIGNIVSASRGTGRVTAIYR